MKLDVYDYLTAGLYSLIIIYCVTTIVRLFQIGQDILEGFYIMDNRDKDDWGYLITPKGKHDWLIGPLISGSILTIGLLLFELCSL